jgi:hypothetical protein
MSERAACPQPNPFPAGGKKTFGGAGPLRPACMEVAGRPEEGRRYD